jgi:DNA-binding transcriptional LysR family regulator
MTLRQLSTFATVARLGSVRAAARELGVSEPAVSAAVRVLRRELGDPLYRRAGHGLVLTLQGERLASLAGEISSLAERARGVGSAAPRGRPVVHVAVTAAVAEHAIGPLLAAFAARAPELDVQVAEVAGRDLARLLDGRRVDVALGPRPALAAARRLVAVPFLRVRLVVVAAPGHPLAGGAALAPAALLRERWLTGPGGTDAGAPLQHLAEHAGLAPADVRVFPSDAAALAAAASGAGVAVTLLHAAAGSLRRRDVVRLPVRGTPLEDRWWATTLPDEACAAGALALRRFACSPEAVHAIASLRGVPAALARAPVHATLWRAVGSG